MPDTLTPKARLEALLDLINSAAREAIAEYERTGEVPSIDTVHPWDTKAPSLALRRAARTLESACEQLCTTLVPPTHTLFNRSFAHLEPTCLQVAVEANIAGILADHPEGLTLADIGKQVNIRPERLGHIVRFLAAKSCFREAREGVFVNNRLSSRLVANTHVSNLFLFTCRDLKFEGAYAWLTDPRYGLSETPEKSPLVRSLNMRGQEQLSFFDWLNQDPKREAFFGSAMVGLNEASGDSEILIENYPFDDLPEGSTFCDVAGGVGHVSMLIAKAYPHIHFTLQDQPSVVEQGQKFIGAQCPEVLQGNRFSFVPFDFLKECPVKDQDIYYLRYIVHDWSDPDAIIILRNVRGAMKPASRLLVHEHILENSYRPDSAKPHDSSIAPEPLLANYGAGNILSHFQDINMMNIFNSKERSLEEFKALGTAAGLEFVKKWDFAVKGIIEFKVPG